jgi:asparagine synthase (glutamine-hydrolysing)
MCGICGHTNDGRGNAVREMNRRMVARGPDDEGCYVDASVGVAIGARRLSILDVEGGHQPLSNEDGTVWAVLNGEIYNYPLLRDRLLARGHELSSRTDTEVLVHLFEDFGVELVHALEGMFAFAVWDSRRRRLLLARDRFGEKPLFYAERGETLAFASELTALLAGTGLGADLDSRAVEACFVEVGVAAQLKDAQAPRSSQPAARPRPSLSRLVVSCLYDRARLRSPSGAPRFRSAVPP